MYEKRGGGGGEGGIGPKSLRTKNSPTRFSQWQDSVFSTMVTLVGGGGGGSSYGCLGCSNTSLDTGSRMVEGLKGQPGRFTRPSAPPAPAFTRPSRPSQCELFDDGRARRLHCGMSLILPEWGSCTRSLALRYALVWAVLRFQSHFVPGGEGICPSPHTRWYIGPRTPGRSGVDGHPRGLSCPGARDATTEGRPSRRGSSAPPLRRLAQRNGQQSPVPASLTPHTSEN